MDPTIVTQVVIAVATLLASLAGFLLAGINERRRDERLHKREIELRLLDRAAKLENEKHGLQRETLLALQDALQKSARLTGKNLHFDHMQARKGKYTQLPEGVSEEMLAADVEVGRLTARVLDPQVRAAVKDFTELATRLSMLPTDLEGLVDQALEYRATEKVKEFGDGYKAVTEIIGVAIRTEIEWQPVSDYAGITGDPT